MSKKKNNPRIEVENQLAKLMEEIEKQNFESKDQLEEFLKNMQGKSLHDLPKRTDKKGRSQDLVSEAHKVSVSKGKKLIKEALELNPDNADAYNYLASIENSADSAMKMFEKAVKAGERTLGKDFIEEEKGHFWGLIETRPYMRAKAGLADCLHAKGKIDKAIEIYEEMIELNPNDNQGIRYQLSTLLLSKNDLVKYEYISKKYDEDSAVWLYNNALFLFKKSGESAKSNKALLKAYRNNKFVAEFIIGAKEMPDELPQYIGRGDEDEAIVYVAHAWEVWIKTEDALGWIYNFRNSQKRVN